MRSGNRWETVRTHFLKRIDPEKNAPCISGDRYFYGLNRDGAEAFARIHFPQTLIRTLRCARGLGLSILEGVVEWRSSLCVGIKAAPMSTF